MDIFADSTSDFLHEKVGSDAMFRVVRSLGLAKIILCISLIAWPQLSTVSTRALDRNAGNFYTNEWAIKVDGGIETAKRIARSYGFDKVEPVSI